MSAAPAYAQGLYIDSAVWADTAKPSLRVSPTDFARDASEHPNYLPAWKELVSMSPDADQPGMENQFRCHWEYARIFQPDKPTWNLEPWRPTVDYNLILAAGCNPDNVYHSRTIEKAPKPPLRYSTPPHIDSPSITLSTPPETKEPTDSPPPSIVLTPENTVEPESEPEKKSLWDIIKGWFS